MNTMPNVHLSIIKTHFEQISSGKVTDRNTHSASFVLIGYTQLVLQEDQS